MRAAILLSLALLALLAPIATVSAGEHSSRSYQSNEARVAQQVRVAKVLMVREVKIQAKKTHTGTVVGAAVGYAAADQINDRRTARVVSSVLGGATGRAVQGKFYRRGLEIYVQEPSGKTWAIVQEADVPVHAGDLVAIVGRSRNLRVVPLDR